MKKLIIAAILSFTVLTTGLAFGEIEGSNAIIKRQGQTIEGIAHIFEVKRGTYKRLRLLARTGAKYFCGLMDIKDGRLEYKRRVFDRYVIMEGLHIVACIPETNDSIDMTILTYTEQ